MTMPKSTNFAPNLLLFAKDHNITRALWGIKMPSYHYRDSHYKDKRVSKSSYICNGNSYTWKYDLHIETGLWWYRPDAKLLNRYLRIVNHGVFTIWVKHLWRHWKMLLTWQSPEPAETVRYSMIHSTKICKLMDLIPVVCQSDCQIPLISYYGVMLTSCSVVVSMDTFCTQLHH